jgi:hypothetical protein
MIFEVRQQFLGYPSNIRFPQDHASVEGIKRILLIDCYQHGYSVSSFGSVGKINHTAQGVNSAPPSSEPILVFMEWIQFQAFLHQTLKRVFQDFTQCWEHVDRPE